MSDSSRAPELLKPPEHRAIELLAELARLLADDIVGPGPSREGDLREAVAHIHDLQHAVMAQAAARAYPGQYRLLGGVPRWDS